LIKEGQIAEYAYIMKEG